MANGVLYQEIHRVITTVEKCKTTKIDTNFSIIPQKTTLWTQFTVQEDDPNQKGKIHGFILNIKPELQWVKTLPQTPKCQSRNLENNTNLNTSISKMNVHKQQKPE